MRKILLILLALFSSPALAQVTPNSYMAPQKVATAGVRFQQGVDAANLFKTLYTGGTNGSICFNIIVNANDSTAAHVVRFALTYNSLSLEIASVTTIQSGSSLVFATPIAALVSNVWPGPISQGGNTYFELKSGDNVQVAYTTALGTSAQINVVAQCADF